MKNNQIHDHDKARLTTMVEDLLQQAKQQGASTAEVAVGMGVGFNVTARMRAVETLEYNRDKDATITVYFGQRQGSASTSDTEPAALKDCVEKACNIARYTQEDKYAGLADKSLMAKELLDLDLCHPWNITPEQAIDLAIQCESIGLDYDKRLTNSDGAFVSTVEAYSVYGNSHGFIGQHHGTRHSINCVLIAKQGEHMQRDYDYSVARDTTDLTAIEIIAKNAAKRTVDHLGARSIATCRVPVIFEASIARRLIGSFLSAIGGTALYRQASFLKDHIGKQVFNQQVVIREEPHLRKGLGSTAFDREGVATKPRKIVENGILQGYLLDSYEARKLNMQTTANAGGAHNIIVSSQKQNLAEMIKSMGKGLLVTSMMGMGINIVTGDFSQGITGFWIEDGEIQYPVEEVTVAENLKNMFLNLVTVGNDVDQRGGIQTGSILLESMMVAGK